MSNKPRVFQARTLLIVLAGGAIAAAAALAPRHASIESTQLGSGAADAAIAADAADTTALPAPAPAARIVHAAPMPSAAGLAAVPAIPSEDLPTTPIPLTAEEEAAISGKNDPEAN